MLKKDKRGRFRKMSESSIAKHEAHVRRVVNESIAQIRTNASVERAEARHVGIDVAPDDTRSEDAQAAIKRIVANLSDSYELADVLVEIRNKLQRIADEAQPLSRYMSNPAEMPIMKDARRAGVISCLGEAIRNARQMATWQPKVDKFATVGDMQTIGGPDSKPFRSRPAPQLRRAWRADSTRRRCGTPPLRDQASDGASVDAARRSGAGPSRTRREDSQG